MTDTIVDDRTVKDMFQRFVVRQMSDKRFCIFDQFKDGNAVTSFCSKDEADRLCRFINDLSGHSWQAERYDCFLDVLRRNYGKKDTLVTFMDGSTLTIPAEKNSYINGKILCVPADRIVMSIEDLVAEHEGDVECYNLDNVKSLS